jgi:DivIVA domain-containing protein
MAGKKSPDTGAGAITPADIQQQEFHVSRFGGYRMRDVDEFLDRVTVSLQAALAENERLRTQATASPVVGTPDLDDVSRQADEIIERARDEAARILAEAKGDAASVAGVAAVAGATEADRVAIQAFLTQERGFLQDLAALVQEHAESVKGMAKQARSTSPKPVVAAGAPEPAAPEPAASEAGASGSATAADAAPPETPTADEPLPDTDATQALPREEPIRVEQPEPATSKAEAEGEASLRELFWGEEN